MPSLINKKQPLRTLRRWLFCCSLWWRRFRKTRGFSVLFPKILHWQNMRTLHHNQNYSDATTGTDWAAVCGFLVFSWVRCSVTKSRKDMLDHMFNKQNITETFCNFPFFKDGPSIYSFPKLSWHVFIFKNCHITTQPTKHEHHKWKAITDLDAHPHASSNWVLSSFFSPLLLCLFSYFPTCILFFLKGSCVQKKTKGILGFHDKIGELWLHFHNFKMLFFCPFWYLYVLLIHVNQDPPTHRTLVQKQK